MISRSPSPGAATRTGWVRPSAVVAREMGLAEVLLTPRSGLIGQTLGDTRFRERYDLSVVAVLRAGQPVKDDLRTLRLEFGDTLLVAGGWEFIDLLQAEKHDFLLLSLRFVLHYDVLDQLRNWKRLDGRLHLLCLELRELEQLTDEVIEPACVPEGRFHVALALSRFQIAIFDMHRLQVPLDRGQRTSEVVRHVRHEFSAHPIGLT